MVAVEAECHSCKGTGLYVGMAERDGAAVVCYRCKGSGKEVVTYTPFRGRLPATGVTRVHVSRGYVVGAESSGGLPLAEWTPGEPVPADEAYYCPFLYTNQEWCAHPDPEYGGAPLSLGLRISECPFWSEKSECWAKHHADPKAPLKAY